MIFVEEVLSGGSGKWRARMRVGDNQVVADILAESARLLVGSPVAVEIGIERIIACAPSKEASQILTLPSGHNRLIGEIDGNMEIADGIFLYDLRINTAVQYFSIDGKEIEPMTLNIGDRVAVDVEGLCFYPFSI